MLADCDSLQLSEVLQRVYVESRPRLYGLGETVLSVAASYVHEILGKEELREMLTDEAIDDLVREHHDRTGYISMCLELDERRASRE